MKRLRMADSWLKYESKTAVRTQPRHVETRKSEWKYKLFRGNANGALAHTTINKN